jgi:hypothetical protein
MSMGRNMRKLEMLSSLLLIICALLFYQNYKISDRLSQVEVKFSELQTGTVALAVRQEGINEQLVAFAENVRKFVLQLESLHKEPSEINSHEMPKYEEV